MGDRPKKTKTKSGEPNVSYKKFADSLLPYVRRLRQVGRNVAVYLSQPEFRPCFDETGYANLSSPLQFIQEVEVASDHLNKASSELSKFLESTESIIQSFSMEQIYPIIGLSRNCEKLHTLLQNPTQDFRGDLSPYDDIFVISPQVQMIECKLHEGNNEPKPQGGHNETRQQETTQGGESRQIKTDKPQLANLKIELPPPVDVSNEPWSYFVSNFESTMCFDDECISPERRRELSEKKIGRLQKMVLLKINRAADIAIYSMEWFALINEYLNPIHFSKTSWEDLGPEEQKILRYLGAQQNGSSGGQIALGLGMTENQVDSRLRPEAKLRSSGLVESMGRGPNGGYKLTTLGFEVFEEGEKRELTN